MYSRMHPPSPATNSWTPSPLFAISLDDGVTLHQNFPGSHCHLPTTRLVQSLYLFRALCLCQHGLKPRPPCILTFSAKPSLSHIQGYPHPHLQECPCQRYPNLIFLQGCPLYPLTEASHNRPRPHLQGCLMRRPLIAHSLVVPFQ